MKTKRFFAAVLVLVLSLALFAGCGEKESDTIKIGVLAPTTGDVSIYGIPTLNGIKLAVKEINEAGGILGKKIELLHEDEKGDEVEAVNAYNRLVDKGIVALIGDVTSKPSIAVAALAAEDGIPMITPTGTSAEITEKGDNVFRVCFTDPFQAQMLADFTADNLKYKKVAILYNSSDPYSQGIAVAYKAQAETKGIEIVAYEAYGKDATNFKTQLLSIQQKNPEAIVLPDYTDKVALIAAQAREIEYKGTLMGGDGWDGLYEKINESNRGIMDNSYFTNHFSPTDTADVVANFVSAFKAAYDTTPVSFAALGYDATKLMAKAMENAGSTDKAKVVAALKEIELDCVTGKISFDAKGDPIKDVAIIKLLGGETSLYTKVSAQ